MPMGNPELTSHQVIDQHLDVLADDELTLRQAQARRLQTIRSIYTDSGGDASSIDADAAAAEIACLLHISHRSAQRLLDDAILICDRSFIFAALQRGDIDLARAKIIAELLPTPDLQEQLEDYALFYATDHTPFETRRWILANLPEEHSDLEQRTEFDKRCVGVDHGPAGMSELWAYLPTTVAEEFFAAVDRLARSASEPDDERTLDQRRADAVAALLDERVTVRTSVSVVLPVNQTGATVNGFPVPYSLAWQAALAASDTWSRFLAGPDGRIVAEAPSVHRVTTAVARVVRARDRHCRFPGCHVPAARCDLDHTVPFPQGESTADNLHCLCRRHHRLKHESGWSVRLVGANHLEWTSPRGRTYVTRPPDAFDPAV